MPLIKVFTSAEPPLPDEKARLLRGLSKLLAEHFRKPEQYVMTCLMPRVEMTFGGSDAPACYAEVKNIGTMTSAQTKALSAALTRSLVEVLGVAPDRTYIEFNDAAPHLWGYDGSTFD